MAKHQTSFLVVTSILSAVVSSATTASLVAFGEVSPRPTQPMMRMPEKTYGNTPSSMKAPGWGNAPSWGNQPSWGNSPSWGNAPAWGQNSMKPMRPPENMGNMQGKKEGMTDPCAHLKKQEYQKEYKQESQKQYQQEYQKQYDQKASEVKADQQKPNKQDVIKRLFENIRTVMEGTEQGYRLREDVKKVLREVGFDEHEIAKLEAALAARLKEMNEQEPRPTPSAR